MKAANDDVQMRSDWLFPICTGGERLKDDNGDKLHPTQKPEALLARIMLASTKPGDVVLDPFFGSGTTGAVAKRLGRHFVGVEREQAYIDAANDRIDAVGRWPDADLTMLDRQARRAARRLRQPDRRRPDEARHRRSIDARKRWAAKVRADGTLAIGDSAGSIHRVGAEVQGLDACNGWTFWHYERSGGLTPIDELRRIARLGMERAGASRH